MEPLLAQLIVSHADHVAHLMRGSKLTSFDRLLKPKVEELVARFDELPIVLPCATKTYRHEECEAVPTRASIFRIGPNLVGHMMLWCDSCDPTSAGAPAKQLVLVYSYADVLDFVDEDLGGKSKFYRSWMGQLASVKGCPPKVTAKGAVKFLGG